MTPCWIKAKNKLKLDTPLNFVSTADITGGNSGSPVFNKKAEIVGLVFDGNIQSLAGRFRFDQEMNRALSVDSRGILEALRDIYGAAGMPKPSLSDLNPDFITKTQQAPNPHLAIEALRKLVAEESAKVTRNNVVRQRAFS